MTPERTSPPQHIQHGICVDGGELCYLCEQPIREGDAAVFYDDAAFWNEVVFYHGNCWAAADLAAKQYSSDSVHEGPAVVLHDATCAACAEPIELGDRVVRASGAGARIDPEAGGSGVLPRVFHAACFQSGEA